jgi:hypothetical protein
MEYDAWQSASLRRTGPKTFAGNATFESEPKTVDFITVHSHTENGSTLTFYSPLLWTDTH